MTAPDEAVQIVTEVLERRTVYNVANGSVRARVDASYAIDALREHFDLIPKEVSADIYTVLEYVSRGRGYIGVETYPDFNARRALDALLAREEA